MLIAEPTDEAIRSAGVSHETMVGSRRTTACTTSGSSATGLPTVTEESVHSPSTAGLPDLDLRLKPGATAVDRGVQLPGINDDYTGEAPDPGAYETGLPLAHYGPTE